MLLGEHRLISRDKLKLETIFFSMFKSVDSRHHPDSVIFKKLPSIVQISVARWIKDANPEGLVLTFLVFHPLYHQHFSRCTK